MRKTSWDCFCSAPDARRKQRLRFVNSFVSSPPIPMLKITWASLLQSGDGDGAIVTFRVALRLRPADPGYQGNLRTAYLQKADCVAAAAEFQSALQRAPKYPPLHYDLGLAFTLQDKR